MKLCHTSAMKLIKELENEKEILLDYELNNSQISYKEDEEKLPNDYSFLNTRKQVEELDHKIRKIKSLLARANCNVIIEEFDITIGEALIYLAQLNTTKSTLEVLSRNSQLTRRITQNGIVEYTECSYDTKVAKEELTKIREKINDLQIAIDRANLNNYIEIE